MNPLAKKEGNSRHLRLGCPLRTRSMRPLIRAVACIVLCVCVCACVFVCMCVCVYMYVCVFVLCVVCVFGCVYVCMYVRTCVCECVCSMSAFMCVDHIIHICEQYQSFVPWCKQAHLMLLTQT